MLLAVLVTFGLLQRSNEITAIKATGISLYRIVIPVLLAPTLVAGVLFVSDQLYLPYTNKRQDALRNRIKGKPAQTYLRPDRKWIFGQHSDIYYYQFFDPDRDVFGGILRLPIRSPHLPDHAPHYGASARTGPTRWAGGSTSKDGNEA